MAETAPGSVSAEIAAVRARLEAEAGRPLNGVRLLHEGARAAEDKPTVLALLALAGHLTWSSTAHPDQTALARRTVQLHPGGGDAVAAINGDLLQRLEGDAVTAGSAPEEAAIMPVEVRLLAARHALVRADLDGMLDGAARLVDEFRSEGRQARLPDAMTALATAQLLLGKHRSARATAAQCAALDGRGRAPWSGNLSGVQAWLAAAAGQEAACEALASEAILDAERHSWMPGIGWAECGRALLDLAAGRHEAVLDRLERARQGPARHAFLWRYSWPDYIEAAVRAGSPQRAKPVLHQYEAWAHATGSARPLALLHRARALLAEPDEAGALYARALELHAQAEQPFEEARTRLAYGAWLRRRQHRGAARVHLQTAADLFIRLDAGPWAARAAAELRATGVSTPERQGDGKHLAELTPQELQVVRLAAEGASNREIGAQLFLSPRTVGYHLYKAFPKLGVASRKELAGLSARNRAAHADITEKPWAVQRTTDRSTYPDPDDDSHPTEAAEAANPIASPP
jgi:DNA-binding CsgD family transcriptional regulator